MRMAFLGSGHVGAGLANLLQRAGHEVVLGKATAESGSVDRALAATPALRAAPAAEAVRGADVVFLAVPFGAVRQVVEPLATLLADKVLVDCTNPVGPGISHGLGSQRSGAAEIQSLAPAAKVVKAFSVYGFENLSNPAFPAYSVKPMMPLCGADAAAKATVARLAAEVGWEPLDVGGPEQALHLEHMTLLWVRMVRAGGHSPHLVWAALRR